MVSVLVYRWRFKTPPTIVPGDPHLEGLGGWLILLGFGLLSGILVRLGQLAKTVPVFSSERWQTLTNSASPTYNALMPPALLLELFTTITLFLMTILLVVTFFQKKRVFPMLFVTLLLFQLLAHALDVLLIYRMHQNSVLTHTEAASAAALAPMLLALILWGLYISRSRRVKLTFVN